MSVHCNISTADDVPKTKIALAFVSMCLRPSGSPSTLLCHVMRRRHHRRKMHFFDARWKPLPVKWATIWVCLGWPHFGSGLIGNVLLLKCMVQNFGPSNNGGEFYFHLRTFVSTQLLLFLHTTRREDAIAHERWGRRREVSSRPA